jgi:hypothetical protein
LIRIVEQQDWVIYCIVGVLFAYIIMFKTLHRDISLVEFIAQPFENSNNNFLSWLFTTILFSVSFSVFFSQFIPIVPQYITENLKFFGVVFNKFGFLFTTLLLFYAIKCGITYLFYGSIQELSKFGAYTFVAQKFYMVYSVVILIMSFILYYLPIDKQKFFIVGISMVILAFFLKITIYLFHNQRILPGEWYYKFLYICTLQILPALVMWKFWFF